MADKFLTISSPYFVTDDRNSILLTNENYLESKQKNNIFHTSLGDISTANLIDFCECLPEINFVDFKFKNDAAIIGSFREQYELKLSKRNTFAAEP